MSNKDIKIYGTLLNYTTDNTIAYAAQVLDEDFNGGTHQNVINRRINAIRNEGGITYIDSNLVVDGDIHAHSASIDDALTTGDLTVRADLEVHGVSELGATIVDGNLNVNGNASASSMTLDSLNVDDTMSCDRIRANEFEFGHGSVVGNIESSEVTATKLYPLASEQTDTSIGREDLSWDKLYVKEIFLNYREDGATRYYGYITYDQGNITIGGDNVDSIILDGDVKAKSLQVDGEIVSDSIETNNLTVNENINVGGDIDISGTITCDNIEVNGLDIDAKIAAAIAAVVDEAPSSFDTLKEIADWIENHADSAADMNSRINANTATIESLSNTVTSGLNSLGNSVAGLASSVTTIQGDISSIQTRLTTVENRFSSYYTKSQIDDMISGITPGGDYYTKALIDQMIANLESEIPQINYDTDTGTLVINGTEVPIESSGEITCKKLTVMPDEDEPTVFITIGNDPYGLLSIYNNSFQYQDDPAHFGGEINIFPGNTLMIADPVNGGMINLNMTLTQLVSGLQSISNRVTQLSNNLSSNYYTKSEVDAIALGGEVDLSNYYNKSEVDGFVSSLQSSISSVETTANGAQSSLSNYYTKTESDERFLNVSTINAARVIMTSNVSNATCPVTLANGEYSTVVYKNTDSSEHTLTISTTYISPDGQQILLTVPAGGYAEVSYMKVENEIYVRGL